MRTLRLATIAAVLALALAVLVLATGCSAPAASTTTSGGGGTGNATPANTGVSGLTVIEQNFAFSPGNVDAHVGQTIVFLNKDAATHEVTIDGKDLGQQETGKSVTWKATRAGVFPFSCIIHPSMTGQVSVTK